jgi:hypothetical protein
MLHDADRSKDQAPASFRRMLTAIRSLEHKVHRLWVDNYTVFLGAAFRNLLGELNIAVEITVPYAHWQHGRTERQGGTLAPMAHSMIRQAALPKSYWALAMAAAVHVHNLVHSGWAGGVPFTLATGRRADLAPCGGSLAVRPMSTLISLNAENLTMARGRVSLRGTLPSHRRGWCKILLLVGC